MLFICGTTAITLILMHKICLESRMDSGMRLAGDLDTHVKLDFTKLSPTINNYLPQAQIINIKKYSLNIKATQYVVGLMID